MKVLRRAGKHRCVFAGPSLSGHALPSDIHVFPPATRGAVTAAVRAGFTDIGFIDGAVEEAERLPLRELRTALHTPGITVLGGASLGAVRAAQLDSMGMRGIGRVFRLFRRGRLTDSDEVYVLHAPGALRYRNLTLPLVNIRYTLRTLRKSGHITNAEEQTLLRIVRDVPWFDRDRHSITAAAYRTCGSARSARVMQAFDRMYRDIKQEDALAVVAHLMSREAADRAGTQFGCPRPRLLNARRA
jgi:hypothetical protein